MALIRSQNSSAEWSNYKLNDYEQQKQDFLKDIQVEAEQILKRANSQAASVLQNAYQKGREKLLQEVEDLKKKSVDEGYKEGFEKGKAEGLAQESERFKGEVEPIVTLLKDVAVNFNQESMAVIHQAEDKLVDASLDLAKAVIEVEPKFNKEILLARLKKALNFLRPELELVVKVNSQDLELAQKFLPSLLEDLGTTSDVKWVASDEVEPSGVQVRSGESEVQFNSFLQWEKLLNLLKEKSQKG